MTLNGIIGWFDLHRDRRNLQPEAFSESGSKFHWLPQYLSLLAGIIVQRFFRAYMVTNSWQMSGFWGWVVAAIIIALIAFPGVYRASFDPDKPLFVQLCVIFASGMGWESLVGTTLKVVGQND